jgi:hypothetical protein
VFLSQCNGEPQYIPDSLITRPQDGADLTWPAFLQCYGREVESWELFCYFADHEYDWSSTATIALTLELPLPILADRLTAMARGRLLEERIEPGGPTYCLTCSRPHLRRGVLRLAREWRRPVTTT